jgi:exopolyphosphatase/pppGpp-phosphohydrolase
MENLILFGQDKSTETAICIATYSICSAKNPHNFLSKVKSEAGMSVKALTSYVIR